MICNKGQFLRTSGNIYYGEEENSQKQAVAWNQTRDPGLSRSCYGPHYTAQVGLNALVAHLAAT